MRLDEYQRLADRTSGACGLVYPRDINSQPRLVTALLGLAGEAGEVCDLLKKHLGHGHALDREKVAAELGDVLWYVAEVASSLGLTLGEVAAKNVDKLRRRYPDGFSSERSINRGEAA